MAKAEKVEVASRWLEAFHPVLNSTELHMDLRRFRIPAVFSVLANVDCREEIFTLLPLVSIVNMTFASSVLRLSALQHLQLRMNSFLAPFGEPFELRQIMRETCSTVFDASALVFLTQLVDEYRQYNILHLSVGLRKGKNLTDELLKLGYVRNDKGKKWKENRRQRVNPFSECGTMYTRSRLDTHIFVVCLIDESALMPCVGVACTALMNSVGPDSVWMAYPKWTFGNHAITNTLLHLKERINSYTEDMKDSETVVRNLGIFVYSGLRKLNHEFRRVGTCEAGDCPQTRRTNDDSTSFNLFFANVAESELEKEAWMERDKGGYGVYWRLSGLKCYKDTKVMEPFAVAVKGLGGQKGWENSYGSDEGI